MALTVITPTTDQDGNERFDVSVTIDGETETLEGLYDEESCMRFSHMKMAYHDNKYVRRASLANRYGNR